MPAREEAMLRDLEIQWHDHFHMRDQTWKTLTNSSVFFLGVVGLEMKGVPTLVMLPIYFLLALVGIMGFMIARHHMNRQKQKFLLITEYEKLLGLWDIKKSYVVAPQRGTLEKEIAARFIQVVPLFFTVLAVTLFVRRLCMN